MNRRDFLLVTAAVSTVAPLAARSAVPGFVEYQPGLVDKLLAEGETVFLDFHATWCTTCRAQGRAMTEILADNPALAEHVTFVRVDWDQFRNDDLTTRLRIPRRSTLVALKGDEELGRIVAGTGRDEIRGLMETALAAATGA